MLCDTQGVFGHPPGMCDPPSDLSARDGSGTDLAWRSFKLLLWSVTYLIQPTCRPTRASQVTKSGASSTAPTHLAFRERFALLPGDPSGIPCSYRGTFAQMLRMTQDMRCIEFEGRPQRPHHRRPELRHGGLRAVGIDPSPWSWKTAIQAGKHWTTAP